MKKERKDKERQGDMKPVGRNTQMKKCHLVEFYEQETPPMVGSVQEFKNPPVDMLMVCGGEMVDFGCEGVILADRYHTERCRHRIGRIMCWQRVGCNFFSNQMQSNAQRRFVRVHRVMLCGTVDRRSNLELPR